MGNERIAVLDLFAGAGGLTAGFHVTSDRFQSVRAVEMDLSAAASYEATFGARIVYAGTIQDWLKNEAIPSGVDVVVGGPPCQGFSTLGKQDIEDERNKLWEYYAETILRAGPKYFVVENVAAFAKSKQFQDFVDATSSVGKLRDYSFNYGVLNAADFGAAQNRKRAVLIGHHRDLPAPGMPEPTHAGRHRTVRDELGDVSETVSGIDLPVGREFEFQGHSYPGYFNPHELHLGRRYLQLSLDRFARIPEGGNRFDLPEPLKAPCWVKHTSGSGDVMGRLHWTEPSVTIRTEFFKPEKGRYLHPTANRAITHYEAALLQGFPSSHRFVGSKTSIARQIGNAVPIQLGAAIARHLESRL